MTTSGVPTGPGPLRTGSLRRRVTVIVVAVLAVVLFAILVTVNAVFVYETNRDIAAVLNEQKATAVALAKRDVKPAVLLNQMDNANTRVGLQLVDGQTFGNVPDTDQPLPVDVRMTTATLKSPGPLNNATLWLQLNTAPIVRAQQELRRVLLLVGLIALGVTGAVLVVSVRLALRPLAVITGLARAIAGGSRGWRLSPTRSPLTRGALSRSRSRSKRRCSSVGARGSVRTGHPSAAPTSRRSRKKRCATTPNCASTWFAAATTTTCWR